jgi:hypothetical protein
MKAQINLKNIKAYIQGNIRYQLYYSKFSFFIPKHIKEQIQYRISSMDLECYTMGQCKMCGCNTTALQMSNKECDKPCYPKMQTKSNWTFMLNGGTWFDSINNRMWKLDKNRLQFIRIR